MFGQGREILYSFILPHGVYKTRHLPHYISGSFSHLLHVLKHVCERLALLVLQQELLKPNGLNQQLILVCRKEQTVPGKIIIILTREPNGSSGDHEVLVILAPVELHQVY